MLDDILPNPEGGYYGGVSEADLEWLHKDLAAAGARPKVACAHIPVVSVAVYRQANAMEPDTSVTVRWHAMCRNPGPVLALLRKHKVEVVLTGHLHQNETLRYDGTTHIGQGAVSGAWWRGAHLGNPEGYGLIDLKADGGFDHAYMTYGWKAEA